MKKGFTLVEMLVVIAILGILMAMMVPAAGLVLKRTKISGARSDAGVVATSMLKFQAEYNRWPGPYVPSGEGATDADWVSLMAPKPGVDLPVYQHNPKRIVLFEPGGGALDDTGRFVDPWGTPFQFRVDLGGSGTMDNPDTDIGGAVRGRALAWSAGPDGDLLTWKDNVKSWE